MHKKSTDISTPTHTKNKSKPNERTHFSVSFFYLSHFFSGRTLYGKNCDFYKCERKKHEMWKLDRFSSVIALLLLF